MKIQHKMPPSSETVHHELVQNGWVSFKEPKRFSLLILFSLPFTALSALAIVVLFRAISTFSLQDIISSISIAVPKADPVSGALPLEFDISIIFWLYGLTIIHEIIHLVFVPGFWQSKKTFIGLTWFGGYMITEEIISKRRFILISLAPFIVLSILLPVILQYTGGLSPTMKTLALFNAMGSSVDLLNVLFILIQVPRGKKALLINNGTQTYWKTQNM